jgi:hypothetical protein
MRKQILCVFAVLTLTAFAAGAASAAADKAKLTGEGKASDK